MHFISFLSFIFSFFLFFSTAPFFLLPLVVLPEWHIGQIENAVYVLRVQCYNTCCILVYRYIIVSMTPCTTLCIFPSSCPVLFGLIARIPDCVLSFFVILFFLLQMTWVIFSIYWYFFVCFPHWLPQFFFFFFFFKKI